MDLLLILVLIILLCGGFPAYRSGAIALNNAVGIIVLIVVVMLVLGLVAGPWPHRYW